ncbi:MAG: hypothetical protein HKN14_00600 [Marinicaulis sp.]|nr:hypothetical protein [Marinicaulis sp.]
MDATIGQLAQRVTTVDPQQRQAALADARRQATQTALQSAEAGQARKAKQLDFVRTVLERAVGANTKLSIEKRDNLATFIYRAIDRDSGEVVKEWPPVQFAQMLKENGAADQMIAEALQGLTVDEQA